MKKAYLHNIKYALNKGFHVAVRCMEEGDLLQKPTDSYKLAKEGIESTGMVELIWCKRSEEDNKFKAKAVFAVILDYDQEPDETISDYGINELTEQWAKDYDKECYPAWVNI